MNLPWMHRRALRAATIAPCPCPPPACSNAVLSFAKLEFIPRQDIVDALGQEALVKIATFSPQVGILPGSLLG